MVTMSCSGNLVWDVNKRLIGYSEPNTIRTNYLGKNKTSLFTANGNVEERRKCIIFYHRDEMTAEPSMTVPQASQLSSY